MGARKGIVVIQPLRRAHRWIWLALSLLLPAVFIAGIAARRSTTPPNSGLSWDRTR
jgi:hypothetical protein